MQEDTGSFLKNADFVWTEDLLREWDFNAQAMAKKAGLRTRVPALNMKGSREDEAIAFLSSTWTTIARSISLIKKTIQFTT